MGGRATASFFLFAIAAIIPVLPFLFTSGAAAVLTSLFLASLALFGTGAGITLVTGRGPWRSGLPERRSNVLGGLIHEYRWAAWFGLLNPSRR